MTEKIFSTSFQVPKHLKAGRNSQDMRMHILSSNEIKHSIYNLNFCSNPSIINLKKKPWPALAQDYSPFWGLVSNVGVFV